MHTNNLWFMREMKKSYPDYFVSKKVLELGSFGSGKLRQFFENCEYIGIDIVGRVVDNVDMIVNARETQFPEKHFDVLVCFSEFEHDPYWREAFAHNLPFLKDDALILLCWGAKGNMPHLPEPFGLVPVKGFMDFAKTLPIEIFDSFFEEERYGKDIAGAYDVVAKVKRI